MSLSVTVLGLGAIGLPVARALAEHRLPGLHLHSVSASSPASARRKLGAWAEEIAIHTLDDVAAMGDLVIEALPPAELPALGRAVLGSGRRLLVASIGGLLNDPGLIRAARQPGQILLPAGALGGLDAVRALAFDPGATIRLDSRKPVTGFEQTAELTARGIDLSALTEAVCLFEGSAEDGVRLYPKNVNVVAALSLAGLGPQQTRLALWADPSLSVNCHRISVQSAISDFTAEIRNLPDPENPKTSRITGFSVLATLRNLGGTVRFG